jgi:hypothetical protein
MAFAGRPGKRSVRSDRDACHPTIMRAKQSMTNETYTKPVQVRT